jgi:hypothetical protein
MKTKMTIVALFVATFLSGCVTNKIYDKSLSASEQATLEMPYSLTVTSFDGNKVSWNVGFFGMAYGFGKAVVQIPSGEHSLVVDYFMQTKIGNTLRSYSAEDLQVHYNFLPMHTYKLTSTGLGNFIMVRVDEITQSQQ